MPVPMNKNCRIEIYFPQQITLDKTTLSSVTGLSLFGAQRTFTGIMDTSSNSYIITDGCNTYKDNTLPAIIYFDSIKNPSFVMTTD